MMRKGIVCVLGASLAAIAGAALAQGPDLLDLSQPEPSFWRWDLSALIASFGALATSVAAIAAWRASRHSQKQAEIVAKQEMRSQLESHRRSFFDDLKRLELQYPVEFFKPADLYLKLFPANTAPGESFSYEGNQQFLEEIQDEYLKLCREANDMDGIARLSIWAHQVNVLAIKCGVDPFVYQGVFWNTFSPAIEKLRKYHPDLNPEWQLVHSGMPTGFSMISCNSVFYNLYNAIDHLVTLGGAEHIIKGQFIERSFIDQMLGYIVSQPGAKVDPAG